MCKSNDEIERDILWESMVVWGIATTEELGLAVALCGNTLQTLERVLYIRTGYRSLEQIREEEY